MSVLEEYLIATWAGYQNICFATIRWIFVLITCGNTMQNLTSFPYSCVLALALISATANAESALCESEDYPMLTIWNKCIFWSTSQEGWFWYKRHAEEIPEDEKRTSGEMNPDTAGVPERLSVKWLKEHSEEYLARAIDNPTPDNVRTYYLMQKVMMDKSEKFAQIAAKIGVEPSINETLLMPTASYAAKALEKDLSDRKRMIIERLAGGKLGIFFFYRSDCRYSALMGKMLRQFILSRGITVKAIAADGKYLPDSGFRDFVADRGQAAIWGITSVPALVAFDAESGRTLPFAFGLMNANELDDALLSAAESLNLLTGDELRLLHPEQTGVSSAESELVLLLGNGQESDIHFN